MHKAKILYASETGNGEEITRMLEEECVYGSIPAERFCFSQIGTDFSLNPPEVCVIVVSSTGDGEMPSNGIPLLRWLRTEQPNLTGIRFAMLGLGDSNYSTYMGNPRNLYTIFKNLGAEEFIPLTEADEQCGMEDVVEPWMAKV